MYSHFSVFCINPLHQILKCIAVGGHFSLAHWCFYRCITSVHNSLLLIDHFARKTKAMVIETRSNICMTILIIFDVLELVDVMLFPVLSRIKCRITVWVRLVVEPAIPRRFWRLPTLSKIKLPTNDGYVYPFTSFIYVVAFLEQKWNYINLH